MAEHGSRSFTLPNGRQATLTYVDHTGGPGEHRLRLRLVIDHREKKHACSTPPSCSTRAVWCCTSASATSEGVLILGVCCKTQHYVSCYT